MPSLPHLARRLLAPRCRYACAFTQAAGVAATWTQSKSSDSPEVQIKVPVPQAARGRDVKMELHPRRLSLALDGKTLLAGSLADVGEIRLDGE